MSIPKIIHFLYGLEEASSDEPFSLVYFLAVKSAYEVNKPDRIHFYTYQKPSGPWWEATKKYVHQIPINPVKEIFGRTLYHPAHQADVLRLLILLEWGGIYLDLDTICVQPFDDLLHHQFVMGQQGTGFYLEGLGNAILLGQKGSSFAQGWLSTYRTFRSTGRDEYWDEHSVRIPLQLSALYSSTDELHIEPYTSFFTPHYQFGVEKLFETVYPFPKSYCHHLWESVTKEKYLQHLSLENIFSFSTTYHLIARKFLKEYI